MITIPAGEYLMGGSLNDKFANNTERPAHRVAVASFAMGRWPVTVAEYRAAFPEHAADDDLELPVANVNWDEAHAYRDWLGSATGRRYRLPSEAEWEYACRAGSSGPFAFGAEITPANANYFYSESGERIGPGRRTRGGNYPANAFGLYDLHGNVSEWTGDIWHPNYIGAPLNGSAWVEGGDSSRRVIRGGAWDYLPRLLRSAWRDGIAAGCRRDNIGFRVVTTDLPA
jgi:formylglycine-generating enzyme required for sulfatase activity